MREIHFRAMTTAEQPRWAYGSLITYKEDGTADIHGRDIFRDGDQQTLMVQVQPDTIGQYTGVHDSLGRPIYEGDRLTPTGGGAEGVVTWYDQYAAFRLCVTDHISSSAETFDKFVAARHIVIGNIHEQ